MADATIAIASFRPVAVASSGFPSAAESSSTRFFLRRLRFQGHVVSLLASDGKLL